MRVNLVEELIQWDLKKTYDDLDEKGKKKIAQSLKRKRRVLQSISTTASGKVSSQDIPAREVPYRLRRATLKRRLYLQRSD